MMAIGTVVVVVVVALVVTMEAIAVVTVWKGGALGVKGGIFR
jgi:hypothetical protein